MKSISLNGSAWTLTGYWQNQWRMDPPAGVPFRPVMPAVPAVVPGAVHADLYRAGLIGHWNDGLNAQRCEWVNNRDWSLKRAVTVPADFDGQLALECDGLDYSGYLLINGKEISRFEGTHARHQFDLTDRVGPGETFELGFLFDLAPRVDGVYGYTSRTRIFKPRFGYYWDWCTRIVNVGIWQGVQLVSRGPAAFEGCRVLPRVNDDLTSGYVRLAGSVRGEPATLRYVLRDEAGEAIRAGEEQVGLSSFDVLIKLDRVKLWWPATHGDQPLYHLKIELLDGDGKVSDSIERTIGFKRVRWLQNPGAPDGAKPYLCEVNGRALFLRGVNWVPLSPLYGTVSAERYEAFIHLYRNMNVNVLRVWGGGILERPEFYEQCDRQGLLVWQEFPLSSSGIDNWPPEDPEVIAQLERIAAEYIERRCHYACHLLWCGGNELQGALDGGKVGTGKPVDESHPLMQRWAKLVAELDPGKRFQASSPSGPRFHANEEDFGKGIHHQTHGPWRNVPFDERFGYFDGDDSLFRSETGVPGCSSLAALERHRGEQSVWPPRASNLHWLVPASAWIPWDEVTREFGPIPDDPSQLPTVVKASRYLQADSYRYIAEATRRRYPNCSGFIIWMGQDSVHCTSNNSVIQIDASAKPAYDWLQRAWGDRHVSLRHDSIHYAPGRPIVGDVWLHRDQAGAAATGSLTVSLRTLDGRIVESLSVPVSGAGESIRAAAIDWSAPECSERLFVIDLVWEDSGREVSNRYLLSQQADHPLGPMLALPAAALTVERAGDDVVTILNGDEIAALAVRLVGTVPDQAVLTDVNDLIVFPGESCMVRFATVAASADAEPTDLAVEWFNSAGGLPVRM